MANEIIEPDKIRANFGYVVDFPPDGDTEFVLTLEPDEDMTARLNAEDEETPEDVALFDAVLDEKRRVFLERRYQYGAHTVNHDRFPIEHQSGLYIKCARLIRDIERNTVKKDTLLDLSNYCDIELANMEAE